MNRVTVIPALAVAGLLAGGVAAYLTGPAPTTGVSRKPAANTATYSATPAPSPAATPAPSPAGTPAPSPAASPSPSAGAATESFNTWIDGPGGTLLENSLAVLYKAKADATAKNIAALEADGSQLVTCGDTSLADPPPAHAAAWNTAFAAMVRAGEDLEARNLRAAETESVIVRYEIYAFNSQISRAG
jgi:hypothetical protein